MKIIPLTQGLASLVDDSDFEFLDQWKWYACKCKGRFYARRDVMIEKRKFRVFMHRVVAGAVQGQYVDHEDRNTLNNQRGNLRICTQSQNNANQGMSSKNTSGFKGVCWDKSKEKWVAHIKNKGVQKFLGRFDTAAKAGAAYDLALQDRHGEFALTNQILRA